MATLMLVTGIYLMLICLMMDTKGLLARLLFKVCPFFLGLFQFLYGLHLYDLLEMKL